MKKTNLVMNVVIVGVIAREPLQRIEWQGVSAVVVSGLEGGDREQKSGLADRHAGRPLSNASSKHLHSEALDGMAVQCAKRIRHT